MSPVLTQNSVIKRELGRVSRVLGECIETTREGIPQQAVSGHMGVHTVLDDLQEQQEEGEEGEGEVEEKEESTEESGDKKRENRKRAEVRIGRREERRQDGVTSGKELVQ